MLMSKFSVLFNLVAGGADKKRDWHLRAPKDIKVCHNIPYIHGDKYNLLDVYYPKRTTGNLPVIVSIHGGGYVYGTKEIYTHYGMFLAQQGFTVVNFNYHLAPKYKFPTQLIEINEVMEWIDKHCYKYHMDRENVFLVGDSAGAQMASHYAAIYSNPVFARHFPFEVPKRIRIRALALNCGMYDISSKAEKPTEEEKKNFGLSPEAPIKDYLGEDREHIDPLLRVLDHITKDFPPAFIMTAHYDFLRERARPMHDLLKKRGVETVYRLYVGKEQSQLGHVFHCNMNLKEARECNQEECNFFRKYMVRRAKLAMQS